MVRRALGVIGALGAIGCSSAAAPPPPPELIVVTVAASSIPPGATVTGGGAVLGTTPFVASVPASGRGSDSYEFTFQLPGYEARSVTGVAANNTVTLNVTLDEAATAGAPTAPDIPEPNATVGELLGAEHVEPAAPRSLSEIFSDYQPDDAAPRFLWISSLHGNVQLHCDEHAAEAARRGVRAMLRAFPRDAYRCSATECTVAHEGGNSDPRLFAERQRGTDGARLIAYWNGYAGDPSRATVARYLRELDCGEVARLAHDAD